MDSIINHYSSMLDGSAVKSPYCVSYGPTFVAVTGTVF